MKILKSEKGVTLIEVLCALALVSLVLLLASSINLFGQKQVVNQSTEIQSQTNERLALKVITKEIRKAAKVDFVSALNNELFIIDTEKKLDGSTLVKEIKIRKDGTTLVKEMETKQGGVTLNKVTETLMSNIDVFTVNKNENQVKLRIGNTPETTVYIRR
jgi:prepilin-type N-terminal cleavage/methylation domain-containing protein